MKRKMEASELIFKIIAYVLLIIFSALCIYPLLYALGSMFSGFDAVKEGKVVLWPVDVQGKAFMYVATNSKFWINYSNTLFVTFIGTIWCLVYSILGAYALSKKRLMGRHGFNFFLVFTMWFAAGVIPTYLNYQQTGEILASIVGKNSMFDIDLKWLIVLAMGMNATNIVLLRNSFEGVPSEIEEAARIDGATELQILTKVYIPMSKATIATVALFFGISRWNGYFWAYRVLGSSQSYSWPVQVYMRDFMENNTALTSVLPDDPEVKDVGEATSYLYSMVIFAMIPILIIYPFIQKYFAKGVNMGGVKE
ncbi:MAG: carbohydrate ABC transporter permease [Clostridia bacterium]|nr:carbohydrate ABC transporter permease [Clostridia bacterium]